MWSLVRQTKQNKEQENEQTTEIVDEKPKTRKCVEEAEKEKSYMWRDIDDNFFGRTEEKLQQKKVSALPEYYACILLIGN